MSENLPKEERKSQIMDAAMKVITRKGFSNTRMDDIVNEAGLSKGAIYHHYEGKKEIKTRAITHFHLIDSNNNYSLLKLNPQTGRKHQLRKQLLIHGHPILGDSKYRISDKRINNKKDPLMLHAYKINFSINEIKYNFTAAPPSIFNSVLKEKYLKTF